MMGMKQRCLAPLVNVSLEELVPQDHFYRHLERTLDLSFVHRVVDQTYAAAGRPSIDPVVFFKLQLVMFFEGIRSERLLMGHAADRLSVMWYLGYDFGEPLPDHSSLTRIWRTCSPQQAREERRERIRPAARRHPHTMMRCSQRRCKPQCSFPSRCQRRCVRTSPRRIKSAMTGLRHWEHKTAR